MQHNRFYRIFRFLVSGGAATLIHFSVMALLIYIGLLAIYATMLGAIAGAASNYLLQYHYTFRSQRSHRKSAMEFLFASLLAWLSNVVLFVITHQFIGLDVITAQLLVTAIVTVQNYFIYKLVFHARVNTNSYDHENQSHRP